MGCNVTKRLYNNSKKMKVFCKILYIYLVFMLGIAPNWAQKLNTDSLLVVTNNLIKSNLNQATTAKKIAHKCIKFSPNYLDFHIALGRIYNIEKNKDSANYYFQYVINKNTNYKEAFYYLSKLQIDANEFQKATETLNKAIEIHPEELDFYKLKLQLILNEEKPEKSINFLNELLAKFPENTAFIQQLKEEKSKIKHNRISTNYHVTFFDRDNYGPWHLTNIHYARQFKKFSIGARLNYLDRRRNGESDKTGYFYELESYFKTTRKSYSFANLGYSNNTIFPKFRVLYSLYYSIGKGFETETGFRHNQRQENQSTTGILALGKYFGSNWINLRTSSQLNEPKLYPSVSLQYRHYFNSRFDFFGLNMGYGTSPDERENLSQFEERVALSSYRFGGTFNKLIAQKYALGVSSSYNRQEYFPEKFQKEYTISLILIYLF